MNLNKDMFTVKAKVHEGWKKGNPDVEETWVKGCLIIAEDRKNEMQYRVQPTQGHYYFAFPIDPETICRPTGQKDKVENPIYEHDKCFVEGSGVDYEDGLFEVLWDEETSRFVLSGQGLVLDFDNTYGYECTVMGNAYDNPELEMEEKEVE